MAANPVIMLALALIAMLTVQRIACDQEATKLEDQDVSSAEEEPKAGDAQMQQKQQSTWPTLLFGAPQRARENPDFFLIMLKPYEPFIPQQIQEMIDKQVRPMTEQISSQIISTVPQSEQMYQQVQQFMNLFQNFGVGNIMGAMGSLGGGGGGSSAASGASSRIPGLGRRR